MSGFEAIGLVLGIYPLVVNGLQLYKSAKNGQEWDLLHDEFRTEEIIYVECIQHLLASDISEADLLQLSTRDKPNQALWEDAALGNSLRNRLGHEKSPMVHKTLQEMDMLLTTLNDKLKSHEIITVSTLFHDSAKALRLKYAQGTIKLEIPQCCSQYERHPPPSERQGESAQATRTQRSTAETSHQQCELWVPGSEQNLEAIDQPPSRRLTPNICSSKRAS
jgi:hypothetical protein